MSKKFMTSTLLTIAGIIILGLIFNWDYETWRVVDIAIIVALIFLSATLYKNDSTKTLNTSWIKKINKKMTMRIIGVLILIFVLGVLLSIIKYQKSIEDRKCRFTLSNIKENRYHEDREAVKLPDEFTTPRGSRIRLFLSDQQATHKTYWEIDGLLENNSDKPQYLSGVILKVYSADDKNILLTEGFRDTDEYLTPNQTYPFQIRAQIDRTDPVLGKYFDKDDSVRLNVYPWFNTCN